ncbi:hypothetical protein TCAL_09221 [Tigriopus californicus]|uniref:Histone-lysine N-methyltransferase n=1 Tax=Tigriopus californicus TaxID=6832 RepID=A0A553PFZ2_TIGCA|nr:histone-lysine N-methyltransferase SETDB1-B-like [Tigriopus californicus]TRY76583.1 hypothetical protein TCAL_09221 [Tigriopus californicus]|eukprot:TCALIF_09221-PA protein Name:"Similar to egg Histone-lysine N-methyltransferase eggless (Drosophila pseudoobscura pseudoobscura)" AED:0.03 eAED:0.05 QI:0/-1/0/1/-1/1/1/0/1129
MEVAEAPSNPQPADSPPRVVGVDSAQARQSGVPPSEKPVSKVTSRLDQVLSQIAGDEAWAPPSTGDSDSNTIFEDRVRPTVRARVTVDWQCLNPLCPSGSVGKSSLITASRFLTEFFAVKLDGQRKRKVCPRCRDQAEQARHRMVERARQGQLCLWAGLPTPRDMVTLDDSDEETVTDSSSDEEIDLTLSGDPPTAHMVRSLLNQVLTESRLQEQVDQAIDHIDARLQATEVAMTETSLQFQAIEQQVDDMRQALYQPFRPQMSFLPPLDLNQADEEAEQQAHLGFHGRQVASKRTAAGGTPSNLPKSTGLMVSEHINPGVASLPPMGQLKRPLLNIGDRAFGMRGNILSVWKVGEVIEIQKDGKEAEPTYKLRFEGSGPGRPRNNQVKMLALKHMAFHNPAPVRLPVGTRVIAVYRDSRIRISEMYSGVVAEPPKVMNRFRYLIFFDDGYASYIHHEDIRVACAQSKDVWDDVHPNSREFIKKYLQQYPERPMVKLNVGQIVRTEWQGKWWITKVVDVDASLVLLVFQADKRTETIYRGSTRLGPLFLELQQQKRREEKQAGTGHQKRMRWGGPYVEYTRQSDAIADAAAVEKRAVARKTTSKRPESTADPNFTPQVRWESKGDIFPAVISDLQTPKEFTSHDCSPSCLGENGQYQYDEKKHKNNNPFLIPILLGWRRLLTKHRNHGRRTIFYLAPCGRRIRTLEEILKYLRITGSLLEIDLFTFDWWVHIYNEFKPERELCSIKDVSYGKENVPISCVNSLDKNFPEYVEYSRVRLPQKDVNINTDENFLVCCDCTDDCQDKSKCACWQLTIQNTAASPDGETNPNAGYSYRRLHDVVPTGIFECNSGCKCKQTCMNRVAQNPLRSKLQIFKTERRGWGIRTLCDIPEGTFLCIYVGNLYCTEEANVHGQNFGDEYFAELDMIETVEKQKEGYESDYDDEECEILSTYNESESAASTEDEDEANGQEKLRKDELGGFRSKATPLGVSQDRPTRTTRKKTQDGFRENGDSDHQSLNRKTDKVKETADKPKFKSTRLYFGDKEDVYIMDAKSIGNIGRYLNHSCTPNVFVQNCFVDTHDLRFPWVAFFSSTYIKAGQELCWDYCYIVDQVKGKEIYCQCGSDQCRGRLL